MLGLLHDPQSLEEFHDFLVYNGRVVRVTRVVVHVLQLPFLDNFICEYLQAFENKLIVS